MEMSARAGAPAAMPAPMAQDSAKRLGVTIEATYTVGEYDILILSAKESGGLATWLTQNGYKMPQGAAPVLASYLAQNMRFFVAKVNLGEQAKLGFNYLRPLQIAYESPKFMLPIRLGTLNAEGTQELFVFALTNKGRVETTNYRTVRLPSDVEIPTYVKGDFAKLLQRDVLDAGPEAEHVDGVPRVRLGHGLVRPVRRRSAVERPAAQAGRVLAGRRRDAARRPAARSGRRRCRVRCRAAAPATCS